MAIIDLGLGGKLESFELTPSFARTPPYADIELAKPEPGKKDDDLGCVRFASSAIPEANTKEQSTFGAAASGIIRGANFVIGFKQLAFLRFYTAFYAGLKDSDGSIVDSSAGFNGQQFLDCSTTRDLRSPWAPFYVPRRVAPNGRAFDISMFDQPRGRIPLQRRNGKRDRLNFLISFSTSCRFLTYFVVERPNGTHLPIKGVGWAYKQSFDMDWRQGKPQKPTSVGSVESLGFVDNLRPGDARFAMLANPKLSDSATLVSQFNQEMSAAHAGLPGRGGYQCIEYENYTDLIAQEMRSRTIS